VGNGPIDVLVNVTHPVFPIDLMWDEPRLVYFLNRLSSFCRHIWFDTRGTGASDWIPSAEGQLLESVVEDMEAVLNQVGCGRVTVLGLGPAQNSLLFAAAHPERIGALVLVNPSARYRRAADYPEGLSDEEVEAILARADQPGSLTESVAPSAVDDTRFRRWLERSWRLTGPPAQRQERLASAFDVDLRAVLPSIRVPTLVINRRDRRVADQARFVAEHIAGAEYAEVPGADALSFVGDASALCDVIERFATGHRVPTETDRVLATVLFTDLVNSTGTVAALGDRRWRELLATHDILVADELDRSRGRAVKHTGDGVLATFDGPARAIRCACAIRDALRPLGLDIRAGLHSGEIELHGDDIAGIAVHVSQRVEANASPGEILVSRTVADLIAGSDIQLADRGEHQLKGVPGTWQLFSVRD
jgi:class 3 adenylate cyclase